MIIKSLPLVLCIVTNLAGANPIGSPGVNPNWTSAKKVQVGTSASKKSKIWFTNAKGILTESYFPTIDRAQIKDAQLVATGPDGYFSDEKKRAFHQVESVSPSLVRLINRDYYHRYQIEHLFYTARSENILIDEVTVDAYTDDLKFYHLVNTALNNSGYRDSAKVVPEGILFYEQETELLVQSSVGYLKKTVGYVGHSEGYQDLKTSGELTDLSTEASNGNVAATAQINIPAKKGRYKFYLLYHFKNDTSSFNVNGNWGQEKEHYRNDWKKVLGEYHQLKKEFGHYNDSYLRSLYVLRVHEDKIHPGAMVASLSVPWGEDHFYLEPENIGGYHLVWPRDLYHVALALLASGDIKTPQRALAFLQSIQYKKGTWNNYGPRIIAKKGAFPQNVWVNGREYWGGLQMDQVGYPVHLFYQIYLKLDSNKQKIFLAKYRQMLLDALDFIKTYGPWTGQERWEENFGISPSSFAVSTSALIIGGRLFPRHDYLKVAENYLTRPGDNIHTWTYTTLGTYPEKEYYLRIAGCDNFIGEWNPNLDHQCKISNSWEMVNQKDILDQGFLKLALLGLVDASDEKIVKSKIVIDKYIKNETLRGPGWHRYSFDAYGDGGKGRLWPLLAGEHGRYHIELFNEGKINLKQLQQRVAPLLDSFLGFSNSGQLISEQVLEETGAPTESATPLAWSHAEYIKLLWSLANKKNVENILEK